MRILLIGRTGQLGADLLRNNKDHELIAPDRAVLDVTFPDQVRASLREYQPELVVNCAAFHNVPLCEQDPGTAFKVNCVAMRDLAIACRESDARLLTFSSDYVFGSDRREPHPEDGLPHPLQIYGISRLAGEHAVVAAAPDHAMVVRTCGLYGQSGARSKGGNFVDGRVADALAGRRIEMACEQVVSPTSTADLSRAVFELIVHPGAGPGIYHLVNEGACSWYEFTSEIVRIVGAQVEVVPVDRGGKSGNMRRPLYSALANRRAKALGIALRPWQEAVTAYLRAKYREIA
ncbi:MAG: dTDP-4-dehydrorhamnose reductase [Betaproteobacteria bacterium]|nr:dTDP-4-dehydrorhamnose reductase [Betaproteobacteria bacterium]